MTTVDEFIKNYVQLHDAEKAKKDLASMLENAYSSGWSDGRLDAEQEFSEAEGM